MFIFTFWHSGITRGFHVWSPLCTLPFLLPSLDPSTSEPLWSRPGLSSSSLAFHHSLKFQFSDFFKAGHKLLQSLQRYLQQTPDLPAPVSPQPCYLLVTTDPKQLVRSLLQRLSPWPPDLSQPLFDLCLEHITASLCGRVVFSMFPTQPHAFVFPCSCLLPSTIAVTITFFVLGFHWSSHWSYFLNKHLLYLSDLNSSEGDECW